MTSETYESVWDAICDTREEAVNLQLRSELMSAIRTRVKGWKRAETESAMRLGLTRPRLNDLTRGKLEKFSLDALVNIAVAAGFRPSIHLNDAT